MVHEEFLFILFYFLFSYKSLFYQFSIDISANTIDTTITTMGFTIGLNLLLLLAMVATKIITLPNLALTNLVWLLAITPI